MAICVIGGLLFALLLSLVVTPTIYAMLRRTSADVAHDVV
jgi:multidrug efflux pump subunit AcrB